MDFIRLARLNQAGKQLKLSEKRLKLGILISGRGSNMTAILEAVKNKELSAETAVVITDNPKAAGLASAREYGVVTAIVDPAAFSTKDLHEKAVLKILHNHSVELVVLAGYMRIISKEILQAFPNRVVNIHPALLPSFKGLNAQKQALDYGVRFTGCTVHFVNEDLDGGPIILQAVVPVDQDDTVEDLSQRILDQEHKLYTKAIQLLANGKLEIFKDKVRINTVT
ncbi:phosphoribosylglycinamide formyltransferase [Thermoproteota archaeon]